jgi:type I restriction enzyme S subunit
MKTKTEFKQTELGIIPEDWEVKKIKDIGKVITGKTPPTEIKEYFGSDFPFIRIPDMGKSVYIDTSELMLSKKGAECLKNLRLPKDSVMVSCLATVGKVGITAKDSFTNQQINSLVCNKNKVIPLWVYYFFKNNISYLESLGGGGSVYTNISKSKFENSLIYILKIEEQEKIVKVLSDLDEKIELNQRMNKTLEAIGQAIFKQWFVNFEFPNEEGKPYKSSGGEIVYSEELEKEIPKSWEVGKLEDMLTISIGGDWGEDKEFKDSIPVICLRGTDLQSLKESGYSPEAPVRWITKTSLEKRQITSCDILIGGSGLGPIGRSIYFHNAIKNLYDYLINYSNFCKKLNAQNQENAIYSEIIIENMYNSWEMSKYFTGTSVPNLDANGLLTENIIVPQDNLLKQFAQFVQLKLSHHYKKENQTLSQIRDSLLSKLMSGKIRVKVDKEGGM